MCCLAGGHVSRAVGVVPVGLDRGVGAVKACGVGGFILLLRPLRARLSLCGDGGFVLLLSLLRVRLSLRYSRHCVVSEVLRLRRREVLEGVKWGFHDALIGLFVSVFPEGLLYLLGLVGLLTRELMEVALFPD